MIKPGKITDHSFVITVIAFADLHGGDLCQAHFKVPPEGVLVQRLTASLHMALRNTFRVRELNTTRHVIITHSHQEQDLLLVWLACAYLQ